MKGGRIALMNVDLSALPTDVDALTALVQELVSELKAKELLNAQLEARIAKLKRLQFGKSSEKLAREVAQLELALEEQHEDDGARDAQRPAELRAAFAKPVRRPLPVEAIPTIVSIDPTTGAPISRHRLVPSIPKPQQPQPQPFSVLAPRVPVTNAPR